MVRCLLLLGSSACDGCQSGCSLFDDRFLGCDYDLCAQCMAEVLLPQLSIASDGSCIYIADNEQGLFAKVGTGKQGTIDGHVYKQISGKLASTADALNSPWSEQPIL